MKTAAELYPDFKSSYPYPMLYDYQPIIEAIGEVVFQEDEGDYLGDTTVLYRDGARHGYLVFGWGSCSRFDALQECEGISDVQELMDDLNQSVKWFDDLDALQSYFAAKDWQLDAAWHMHPGKTFIDRVLNYKP
jgi:hypothetical protein